MVDYGETLRRGRNASWHKDGLRDILCDRGEDCRIISINDIQNIEVKL
jgi:hypothetical protein